MWGDDRAVPHAIPGRCLADDVAEGPTERPEAGEPDVEADVRDATLGLAQQEHRTLDPASLQIPVWRLAEHFPEAAAEVGRRDMRDGRDGPDVEWLGVGTVHRVAGPEQAAIEVLDVAGHASTLRHRGARLGARYGMDSPASSRRNSSSSRTGTPSCSAFSSFEPAFSPATR